MALSFGLFEMLLPHRVSQFARLLGPGGHPQIRGLIGNELTLKLTQEGIISDPGTCEAIGALNIFAEWLSVSPLYILPDGLHEKLLRLVNTGTLNTMEWNRSLTVQTSSLFQAPGYANILVPNSNGEFTFKAEQWAKWMQQLKSSGGQVQNNIPSAAPPGAQPPPSAGELHPWAFGGVLNIDISNGNAFAGPPDPHIDPSLLELITLVWVQQVAAKQAQTRLARMMALSIGIITSGGSITSAKLQAIRMASREMGGEGINFSRDAVVKGWDFLSRVWTGEQTGKDFKNMFQALGKVAGRFSPQLRQMCEQTAHMGLTGIITINCAMRTFTDFPWQSLVDLITQRTGRDESANAETFIKYLQNSGDEAGVQIPDTPGEPVERPGYQWAGWTFALRTQKQEAFCQNTVYSNLLYAGIQLMMLSGKEEGLKHYKGLEKLVISEKAVIDNWIQCYLAQCQAGE